MLVICLNKESKYANLQQSVINKIKQKKLSQTQQQQQQQQVQQDVTNPQLKHNISIPSSTDNDMTSERRRDYGMNPRERQVENYVIKNLEEHMERLDIQEEDYYVKYEDDPNNEWCEPHRKLLKKHLIKLIKESN